MELIGYFLSDLVYGDSKDRKPIVADGNWSTTTNSKSFWLNVMFDRRFPRRFSRDRRFKVEDKPAKEWIRSVQSGHYRQDGRALEQASLSGGQSTLLASGFP